MKNFLFTMIVCCAALSVVAQHSSKKTQLSQKAKTTMEQTKETTRIMEQFNNAFQRHDSKLLDGLIAENCVMESIQGPDGVRYEGAAACYDFWSALASDPNTYFELEEVNACGNRATIKWRYHWGENKLHAVRGVNLMAVKNGQIVEALGYAKTVASTGLDETFKD
jgi:hypothetical protein